MNTPLLFYVFLIFYLPWHPNPTQKQHLLDYNDNDFLHERLRIGDEKAYDFLMDNYYTKLCAYARSLTKDSETAEDIVQNVMANIWSRRKIIKYKKAVSSYLYKSVYNEFLSQFRNKTKVIYLEKKYIEALDTLVEIESPDMDRLLKIVNQEIDNLPQKCKQVFILNKKEGLTHIEISEHLGISLKTIEGHMTRAFKILEKRVGKKTKTILFLLFGFKNVNRAMFR